MGQRVHRMVIGRVRGWSEGGHGGVRRTGDNKDSRARARVRRANMCVRVMHKDDVVGGLEGDDKDE